MTTISTILGAILFLRFGYAVGHQGFLGALGIIFLGHMVTIPTAMAVAEIATNQKVQGGGAHWHHHQPVLAEHRRRHRHRPVPESGHQCCVLCVIAFSEAFDPLIRYLQYEFQVPAVDKRWIGLVSMSLLSVVILSRGANIGMKALYLVVVLLFTSLLFFFLGNPTPAAQDQAFVLNAQIQSPDSFFFVFTIIFPAFTGLVAGLGLSGDLKNPSRSIPRGTLWATIGGFVVYLMVSYKLGVSATPEELASDQLIMEKIALWGPIIPIGLAAASLSSALGSIMVAPRTLQAIGLDRVFPSALLNRWLARGKARDNEPTNAGLVSIVIAFVFVAVGDIDFVAQIISMFFMVTYGVICLISLLEHFAADPSYRPTFRSRWYVSLIGAVTSFWLMFKMNAPYALLSLIIMGSFYMMISGSHKKERGLVNLFRGVIFQLSRQLQILAQRADREDLDTHWRPFTICVSQDTFHRRSAFDMLRWISLKYGFGTYIHFLKGYLTEETNLESRKVLNKLIQLAAGSKNRVYLDTIISPSYTSAIAQVIQLSGISGKGNNMILFEFSHSQPEALQEALDTHDILYSTGFDLCILSTSYKGFGYKKQIHIWITPSDYDNANLMILLGYIILGHPEWKEGLIKIFALYRKEEMRERSEELKTLIREGRLPISLANIINVSLEDDRSSRELIETRSADADLTIMGFNHTQVATQGFRLFTGYEQLGNVLFVSTNSKKEIT
ncbi:MAG: hypothetical protein R2751_14285 [Bacteroidales bacterium]